MRSNPNLKSTFPPLLPLSKLYLLTPGAQGMGVTVRLLHTVLAMAHKDESSLLQLGVPWSHFKATAIICRHKADNQGIEYHHKITPRQIINS